MRLENKIPKEQAAYQHSRSTTEQVLTLKLLVEKAIMTSDVCNPLRHEQGF